MVVKGKSAGKLKKMVQVVVVEEQEAERAADTQADWVYTSVSHIDR